MEEKEEEKLENNYFKTGDYELLISRSEERESANMYLLI